MFCCDDKSQSKKNFTGKENINTKGSDSSSTGGMDTGLDAIASAAPEATHSPSSASVWLFQR
jgi:hypothetical protein